MATDVRLRLLVEAVDNTGAALSQLAARLKEVSKASDDLNKKTQEAGKDSGFQGIGKALSDLLGGFKATGGGAEGLGSSLTALAGKFTAIVGGAVAAYESIKKVAEAIQESTLLAARVETLAVVVQQTGKNAGYSAEQTERYVESVKKQGITTQAAEQSLTRLAQAGIDWAKASDLARIAQDAAVIGNVNSSEAFQRMVYGIQSGQTEILRTLGINVQFEQSYAKLAQQLGKTTDSLTEQERVQARVNIVMEAGAKIQGVYEAAMETAGKQWLSMERYVEEAHLALGKFFTPAFGEIIKYLTEQTKSLGEALKKFWDTPKGVEVINSFRDLTKEVLDLINAVLTLGKGGKGGEGMVSILQLAAAAADKLRELIEAVKLAVVGITAPLRGWLMILQMFTPETNKYKLAVEDLKAVELKKTEDVRKASESERAEYAASLKERLAGFLQIRSNLAAMGGAISPQVESNIKRILDALKELGSMKIPKEIVNLDAPLKYTDEQIKKTFANLKKAYDEAKKQAEDYGKKVIDIEAQIAAAKTKTADLIRGLDQKLMTDQEAWEDKRSQVSEKLAQARALAEKAANETNIEAQKKGFEEAQKLAEEAQKIASSLAVEVKQKDEQGAEQVIQTLQETIPVAKDLAQQAGDTITSILEGYKKVTEANKTKYEDEAANLKKLLDELTQKREAKIEITQTGLEDIKKKLEEITQTKWTIPVEVQTPSGTTTINKYTEEAPKFASGGRIPGPDSPYDTVPVLARPGEWFIRNESAQAWTRLFGPEFMEGINRPYSRFGQQIALLVKSMQKFASGGEVSPYYTDPSGGTLWTSFGSKSNFDIPSGNQVPYWLDSTMGSLWTTFGSKGGGMGGGSKLGTINLAVGGQNYPVMTSTDVASKLKEAIRRETMMRTS